ncbi:hypothetical protein DVH24_002968 [Malus domestica]|uniref:Uncharacterized protein n=1 Tax=Malus domestica TaxID=3750 RepID=A0A498K3W2_MALDO|nr:hypothetical protein DVH24_002968 [Malus domestica]
MSMEIPRVLSHFNRIKISLTMKDSVAVIPVDGIRKRDETEWRGSKDALGWKQRGRRRRRRCYDFVFHGCGTSRSREVRRNKNSPKICLVEQRVPPVLGAPNVGQSASFHSVPSRPMYQTVPKRIPMSMWRGEMVERDQKLETSPPTYSTCISLFMGNNFHTLFYTFFVSAMESLFKASLCICLFRSNILYSALSMYISLSWMF